MQTILKCPHCKADIDDPEDSNDPMIDYDYDCPHCGKAFIFEIDWIKYFIAHKSRKTRDEQQAKREE